MIPLRPYKGDLEPGLNPRTKYSCIKKSKAKNGNMEVNSPLKKVETNPLPPASVSSSKLPPISLADTPSKQPFPQASPLPAITPTRTAEEAVAVSEAPNDVIKSPFTPLPPILKAGSEGKDEGDTLVGSSGPAAASDNVGHVTINSAQSEVKDELKTLEDESSDPTKESKSSSEDGSSVDKTVKIQGVQGVQGEQSIKDENGSAHECPGQGSQENATEGVTDGNAPGANNEADEKENHETPHPATTHQVNSAAHIEEYFTTKRVHKLFQEMLEGLIYSKPDEPLDFMLEHLTKK